MTWRRIWVIVAGGAIAAAVTAILTAHPAPPRPADPRVADEQLYAEILADTRSGDRYHDAAGFHLRSRGYPLASVFNWRLPALYVGLASVPDIASRVIAFGLAAWLVVRAGPIAPGLIGPLPAVLGLLVVLVPAMLLFTELWAGLCLGHAVVAYAKGDQRSGVTWAIAALCLRELAAPFCLVAGVRSVWRRDWREVSAWAIGGAVFAVYYVWHVSEVLARIQPGDPAHRASWIALGGLPFVVSLFRTALTPLLALPPVATGIAVAVAIAAWWSPRMPWHLRASAVAYVAFFSVIGLPINLYWAFLVAPMLGLWLVYVPSGIMALGRQGRTGSIRSSRRSMASANRQCL